MERRSVGLLLVLLENRDGGEGGRGSHGGGVEQGSLEHLEEEHRRGGAERAKSFDQSGGGGERVLGGRGSASGELAVGIAMFFEL